MVYVYLLDWKTALWDVLLAVCRKSEFSKLVVRKGLTCSRFNQHWHCFPDATTHKLHTYLSSLATEKTLLPTSIKIIQKLGFPVLSGTQASTAGYANRIHIPKSMYVFLLLFACFQNYGNMTWQRSHTEQSASAAVSEYCFLWMAHR